MNLYRIKLTLTVLQIIIFLPSFSQISWQELSFPSTSEIREGFQSPPPEYGPNLVWGWNGPMDEKVIERDLDLIHSLGFPAVIIEAGYRMKDPYLSDDWFRMVAKAVKEAKKRGMRVWLIDEGKYPSGFAGGKFSSERPDLRMQGLQVASRIKPADGETLNLELPDNIISAAAYNKQDSSGIIIDISSGKLNWTAPGNGWIIMLVRHRFRTSVTRAANNPTGGKDTVNSLCDYLNPLATKQFIEFTHEGYKRFLYDEFGKTLLGFRGDEPDYGFIPWTPAIVEKFLEKKGYDIRPYIASFYLPDPDEQMLRAKADYWDVWSTLFGKNFFSMQAEWCAENNLEYMVHMNHEDKMMHLARSGGDFFKNMRDVQIPGVDAIWNQIWMDKVADFPKLASSAAHLNGRPRAMSESFAAYRIRPNIQQAKWVLDHQFTRGINLFEIMFFGSSAEGRGQPRGWMASDSFPSLMQYANRVSWVLAQGRPAAKIGLFLPTSSMWLGDEEANIKTWEIARQLLEQQRDFDFVDEYTLAKELEMSDGKIINKSGQAYHAVIIPGSTVISKNVLNRLKEFSDTGGSVFFMGREPSYIMDSVFMDAEPCSINEWAIREPTGEFAPGILSILPARDIILDPSTTSVKYVHRRINHAELYFLFNESNDTVSCRVNLEGSGSVEMLNPYNGKTEQLKEHAPMEKGIGFDILLVPWESRLYMVGSPAEENHVKMEP